MKILKDERMKKIFISAGEASGDLIGALIIEEMKNRNGFSFHGIGGPKMRKAGLNVLIEAENLSVTGFIEALPKVFPAIRAITKGKKFISQEDPEKVLLIDFPEVNMRFLNYSGKRKKKTYYISPPQVWAWRMKRIEKFRDCEKILCIYPFEENFYRAHNIKAIYAGNPVVERIERNFFMKIEKDKKPLLAILPGSRISELKFHINILLKLIEIIKKEKIFEGIGIGIADTVEKFFNKHYRDLFEAMGAFCTSDSLSLLRRAWCAVVVSGTASLESALLETPAVVIYRMSPLTYLIGKNLVRVNFISLPNILLNEGIFPEIIQNVNPQNLYRELHIIMKRRELNYYGEKFKILREIFGQRIFSKTAVEEILNE